MSVLTIQHSNVTGGLNPTWSNAAAAGDSFGPNSGIQTLQIRNQGAVPIIVTVGAQHNCDQNFPHPLTFTVPAQSTPFVAGPFDSAHYVDSSGNVNWTYSFVNLPGPGRLVPSLLPSSYGLGIGTYRYEVTFGNASGETTGSAEMSIITVAGYQAVELDGIPVGPAGTTSRKIYRTLVNGASGAEKLLTTIGDNTTTTFIDTLPDSSLGAALPGSNTAGVPAPGALAITVNTTGTTTSRYQVTFKNASGETLGGAEVTITNGAATPNNSLSSIPLGPSGTTARVIYRTAGGGASGSEKLLTTLNDNTTTTFTDTTADGSLGAAIPVTNTASVVSVAVIAP